MTAGRQRDPGFRRRLALAGLSVVLYLVALVVPALRFAVVGGTEERVLAGWKTALFGWSALFSYNFGWLANFFYVPSLMLMLAGLRRVSLAAAVIAVLLGLQSLMLFGVSIDGNTSAGGVTQMVLSHPDAGFFLWIGAMVVVIAGALWGTPATPDQGHAR